MAQQRRNHAPKPVYDETEKKAALELAAAMGRRAAIRELGISSSTFQRWTEEYPEFWSDLRAGDPDVQKRRFAQRLEDLADRYLSAEHAVLERVEEHLIKSADAKEAAALMKAMGSSRMAATTGSRQIVPEAEVVEHNINFPQLEQAMERLLSASAPQPALTVHSEVEFTEEASNGNHDSSDGRRG